MRYEWVERNPIKLVRQSAKRERTPDILELAELQLLRSKSAVRERTLALLDVATGRRVSDLLALRWCDVDFENLELRVTRPISHQVLGSCNLMKRHIQPAAKAIGIQKENRMAHFPALLRHIAEGKRRGCQNHSGALATR